MKILNIEEIKERNHNECLHYILGYSQAMQKKAIPKSIEKKFNEILKLLKNNDYEIKSKKSIEKL